MTHEIENIVTRAFNDQQKGLKNVLATVVFLEGSSYRKPGVRMVISENGKMTGAVSGGCIENEIKNRSESVFKNGEPKMMTYDGRYRLGCEGILYILLEPFYISEKLYDAFQNVLRSRQDFEIISYFSKVDGSSGNFGSQIIFEQRISFTFNESFDIQNINNSEVYTQTLIPRFKLVIIGGEHDAVKLCAMAALLGWEVEVITSIKDPKTLFDFPGAAEVSPQTPEIAVFNLDQNSAVVMMTHNYAQDFKYLLKLQNSDISYVGILGSGQRREQLLNEITELDLDLSEAFLEKIYSPTGLNIGAVTPEEIALSILAEILSVTRKAKVAELRTLTQKADLN